MMSHTIEILPKMREFMLGLAIINFSFFWRNSEAKTLFVSKFLKNRKNLIFFLAFPFFQERIFFSILWNICFKTILKIYANSYMISRILKFNNSKFLCDIMDILLISFFTIYFRLKISLFLFCCFIDFMLVVGAIHLIIF